MADKKPPTVTVRVQFVPQDLWVGLYWVHNVQGWDGGWWESWRFYLTPIPMLPIKVTVDRSNKQTRAYKRWRAAQETVRTGGRG
jgi:hypothetical protein